MSHLNFQPDASQVLDVTALTHQIKRLLEGSFTQVWVRGEVSNCRKQSSGHIYFSLKDNGSQIPCVLFARDAARQEFELCDGDALTVLGDVAVYAPHGRYQLIVKIALHSGEGRLQVELDRLKRTLASEGLFDAELKKELPTLPQRIAVITSPTGAALRDFLQILQRRNFHGSVVVVPVRVQGKEAAGEIQAALKHAEALSPAFDSIVLTRGGGSIEDLWPFNNESLARSIAASKSHIISAVGHEIDQVLTDYCADLRAETPSAAAEIISSKSLEARQRFLMAARLIEQLGQEIPANKRRHLQEAQSRFQLLSPQRQLAFQSIRVDDTHNRLLHAYKATLTKHSEHQQQLHNRLQAQDPHRRFELAHQNLDAISHRLKFATTQGLQYFSSELAALNKRLENTNLQSALKRGFSILQKTDGTLLTSAKAAQKADRIRARFHDGSVTWRVKHDKDK
ncbi:MAG: exodeoxyribonuclease VII large subunit [Verrucomicrobia bacterium]|nr:exodeoxyribonuclease VII large subunit [Verrucomicrobiota bacterium]